MKNIVTKIVIWITGLSLVLVFTFGKIEFNKQELVSVNLNTEMVQDVEAGLLLTVVGGIALSIFLSLGAYHSSELIRLTASDFVQWYQGWYNDTSFEGQNAWQVQQTIIPYLEGTDQLNNDGTLKNPDNVVLPKETVQAIYETSRFYLNDYNDVGHIKWNALNIGGKVKYLPVIDSIQTWQMDTTINLNLPLVISGVTYYTHRILNTSIYTYDLSDVKISSNFYRFRLDIKRNGTLYATRFSNDIIQEDYYQIIINDGHFMTFNTSNGTFNMFPIFHNQSFEYTLGKKIEFNRLSSSATSFSGTSPQADMFYQTSTYTGIGDTNLIIENGFPSGWDGETVDPPPFYYVPITQDIGGSAPILTPVPPEQESLYTYVPPTGPGTVPIVDIGTGMPYTPGIEETNDPALTVPLPGVDDLLDGTYFKDMAIWFSSWLAITISNITDFWNVAWNNLTLGINWLGLSMKSLLDNMLNVLMYPMNLMLEGVNNIRDNTDKTNWFIDATAWLTGLFVPTDLDIKFTGLMDFFNTKFGLLLYPFELVIDIVDRFLSVQGIDRISFYGFAEQTSGVTILPAFYIDIGDLRSQYDFLDYIFATIKMLVTTFFIFNFIRFLYYYYEDVRDS